MLENSEYVVKKVRFPNGEVEKISLPVLEGWTPEQIKKLSNKDVLVIFAEVIRQITEDPELAECFNCD